MHCAGSGSHEARERRHGGRTFGELVRALAVRPGGNGDHRMVLLSCLIEQGVEDALGRHSRLSAPQRVLLRSIEKT